MEGGVSVAVPVGRVVDRADVAVVGQAEVTAAATAAASKAVPTVVPTEADLVAE